MRKGRPVARELEDLRCVGEATCAWLRAVGISSVAELRRVGPAEAYARVAWRFGRACNRSLLRALDGALRDRNYNELTEARKRRLCKEAGISFTSTTSDE